MRRKKYSFGKRPRPIFNKNNRAKIKGAFFILIALGLAALLLKSFMVYEERPHRRAQAVKTPTKNSKPAPQAPKRQEAAAPILPKNRPEHLMAIILDDWGNNANLLKYVYEIDRPITLSVLPHLRYSEVISREASRRRLGVMLHLPMQAKNTRAPLEPRTIRVTTPDADIRTIFFKALESVPDARGVNNHQGSAATSDRRVMDVFLRAVKEKGLFFVDSNVTPTTVGPQSARAIGLVFLKRDVFIDNEPDMDAIRDQLEKAKSIALRKGRVVVIGHDKAVTLKSIKAVVPEFEKEGIRFVLAEDLTRRK